MSVRVRDIAFVRFQAPDLDAMEMFFTAFGMQRAARQERVLYMRGTDDEGFVHVTHLGETPRFVGVAFEAESLLDLDALTRQHGFSEAVELDGPGGGRVVQALDPNGRCGSIPAPHT